MRDVSETGWMPILQRLNAVMSRSEQFGGELSEEVLLSGGWCGRPAATESEIRAAENRLGVRLPPSYRSFLSISNGWRIFNSFVEQLLPVHEIDRFRFRSPESFASMESAHERLVGRYGYDPSVVSDDVYLDYETPAHNMALRHHYYGDSLLISEASESELVLLNPFVVSADGEWETIFSAHWIPENERFRSFRDYVEKIVRNEEGFEANKSDDIRSEVDGMSYPPNLFQGDE
jgi:hypothetical protein